MKDRGTHHHPMASGNAREALQGSWHAEQIYSRVIILPKPALAGIPQITNDLHLRIQLLHQCKI